MAFFMCVAGANKVEGSMRYYTRNQGYFKPPFWLKVFRTITLKCLHDSNAE